VPLSWFAIVLVSLVALALCARGRYRVSLFALAVLLVVTAVVFIGYLVLFGHHD